MPYVLHCSAAQLPSFSVGSHLSPIFFSDSASISVPVHPIFHCMLYVICYIRHRTEQNRGGEGKGREGKGREGKGREGKGKGRGVRRKPNAPYSTTYYNNNRRPVTLKFFVIILPYCSLYNTVCTWFRPYLSPRSSQFFEHVNICHFPLGYLQWHSENIPRTFASYVGGKKKRPPKTKKHQ